MLRRYFGVPTWSATGNEGITSLDFTEILSELERHQTAESLAQTIPSVHSTTGVKSRRSDFNKQYRGKLWTCGYDVGGLAQMLFPDYNFMGTYEPMGNSTSDQSNTIQTNPTVNDIIVFGMHGPCPYSQKFILREFRGKILYANGEPFGSINPGYGDRVFQIGGPVLSEHSTGSQSDVEYYQKHIIRGVYHGIFTYANFFFEQLPCLHDPAQRPHWKPRTIQSKQSSHPPSKIVYLASNCVPYRQRAATALAKHFYVETGGGCQVNRGKKVAFSSRAAGWKGALRTYSKYKYCMTMENTAIDGYVSEKLVNGFFSGCLPIYYGTKEIFTLFNPDAFIFFDAEHGDLDDLVNTVKHLEQNQTAYEEKLGAPILRDGSATINQYWSLSDSIGGGSLKAKIRTMMAV